MTFPRIFTEFDKRRALELRHQKSELTDSEIITAIVAEIRAEIARRENRSLAAKLAKRTAIKNKRRPKKAKAKRKVRIIYTGGFESNRSRH